MEQCPNHPDRPIDFICKLCERCFCLGCMDKAQGLLLCPDCRSRNAVLKMYREQGVQIAGEEY